MSSLMVVDRDAAATTAKPADLLSLLKKVHRRHVFLDEAALDPNDATEYRVIFVRAANKDVAVTWDAFVADSLSPIVSHARHLLDTKDIELTQVIQEDDNKLVFVFSPVK